MLVFTCFGRGRGVSYLYHSLISVLGVSQATKVVSSLICGVRKRLAESALRASLSQLQLTTGKTLNQPQ